MRGWPDCRFIDQRSHDNVNEFPIADHRVQKRSTGSAADIVGVVVAEYCQVALTDCDFQLVALNSGESLEG
jgi:hypothetical protein